MNGIDDEPDVLVDQTLAVCLALTGAYTSAVAGVRCDFEFDELQRFPSVW